MHAVGWSVFILMVLGAYAMPDSFELTRAHRTANGAPMLVLDDGPLEVNSVKCVRVDNVWDCEPDFLPRGYVIENVRMRELKEYEFCEPGLLPHWFVPTKVCRREVNEYELCDEERKCVVRGGDTPFAVTYDTKYVGESVGKVQALLNSLDEKKAVQVQVNVTEVLRLFNNIKIHVVTGASSLLRDIENLLFDVTDFMFGVFRYTITSTINAAVGLLDIMEYFVLYLCINLLDFVL